MFSSVDLPQPEWPMIAMYSPLATSSEMSRSTSLRVSPLPKVLQTCSIFRYSLDVCAAHTAHRPAPDQFAREGDQAIQEEADDARRRPAPG